MLKGGGGVAYTHALERGGEAYTHALIFHNSERSLTDFETVLNPRCHDCEIFKCCTFES